MDLTVNEHGGKLISTTGFLITSWSTPSRLNLLNITLQKNSHLCAPEVPVGNSLCSDNNCLFTFGLLSSVHKHCSSNTFNNSQSWCLTLAKLRPVLSPLFFSKVYLAHLSHFSYYLRVPAPPERLYLQLIITAWCQNAAINIEVMLRHADKKASVKHSHCHCYHSSQWTATEVMTSN